MHNVVPSEARGVALENERVWDPLHRPVTGLLLGPPHAPGVTYFEIDDAGILNFKQARLMEAGIEAQIV